MLFSLSLFAPAVLLATSFPAFMQGIPRDTCKPDRVLENDAVTAA